MPGIKDDRGGHTGTQQNNSALWWLIISPPPPPPLPLGLFANALTLLGEMYASCAERPPIDWCRCFSFLPCLSWMVLLFFFAIRVQWSFHSYWRLSLSPCVSPTGFQQKQPDPGGKKQVLQPPARRKDLHQRILHWPQHLRWLLTLTAGQRGHRPCRPHLRCVLFRDSWHHAWDPPTLTLYGSWNVNSDAHGCHWRGPLTFSQVPWGTLGNPFCDSHPETRDWNFSNVDQKRVKKKNQNRCKLRETVGNMIPFNFPVIRLYL